MERRSKVKIKAEISDTVAPLEYGCFEPDHLEILYTRGVLTMSFFELV